MLRIQNLNLSVQNRKCLDEIDNNTETIEFLNAEIDNKMAVIKQYKSEIKQLKAEIENKTRVIEWHRLELVNKTRVIAEKNAQIEESIRENSISVWTTTPIIGFLVAVIIVLITIPLILCMCHYFPRAARPPITTNPPIDRNNLEPIDLQDLGPETIIGNDFAHNK